MKFNFFKIAAIYADAYDTRFRSMLAARTLIEMARMADEILPLTVEECEAYLALKNTFVADARRANHAMIAAKKIARDDFGMEVADVEIVPIAAASGTVH